MTDKYAVIGNPIAHSKSPLIHRMFAGQAGQDISYEAVPAPLDGFAATVERLREEGYKGCNVTVPFKLEASNLASYLTPEALEANSANTLTFKDGAIIANNTDGAGLVRDIELNLGVPLQGKRVLLMGAGGAARGVLVPLVFAKVQRLVIANRTLGNAQEMLLHGQRFHEDLPGMEIAAKTYAELRDEQFDVVINATSTGLTDEMLPLPDTIFAPGTLAYDMMYGRETPFMKFAREQGAAIVSDGLGMLVEQAAESFYIWRGVRPDTKPVMAKLREKT
ncbi:MAG: shikimate dehydrogenase [Nitrosomonadales bacterium]|nr:shikimate dehydrogenase [Nitrosomonadales bacterium]